MFSVIVSTDNHYELLSNFFERLIQTTDFTNGEIIVVVNGCSDLKAINYLETLQSNNSFVRVIQYDSKLGYSKANNIAVENSRYENLVFINTDVLPVEHSVENLIEYLESDDTIGVVQGRLVYPQDNTIQSTGHTFEQYFNSHLYKGRAYDDPIVMKTAERQALTSAFYAMKRDVFLKFGGFDEAYVNAYEGMELTLKIRESGLKCMYYPKALAYHITGGSRKKISYDDKYAGILFWTKWHNKIESDLTIYIKEQLTEKMKSQIYFHINCSSLRFWERVLDNLKLNISGEISIRDAFIDKIDFYTAFPYELLKLDEPILITCNDMLFIRGNYNWNEIRDNKNDLVLDAHGNVELLSTVVGKNK